MSIISHVSLGTNDFPRAKAFYDTVLAPLGLKAVVSLDGRAGYGLGFPEFWVQLPQDGAAADPGNGTHVCFNAETEEQVRAFHREALRMGGQDEGEPGPRKEYSDKYYGAFARDIDGNKIEAMCWGKSGT